MHLNGQDEPKTPADAIMYFMMKLSRRVRARQTGDAIDPAYLPLLYSLKMSGPVRLSDFAESTSLDASTISRHVGHLLDLGLILRSADPDDGRARLVQISPLGIKHLTKTLHHRREALAEAMADWSLEDGEDLRRLLIRLSQSLTPQSHTPTPARADERVAP
ncbi:MarR family transcriptional regulator [soil metagenome]